MSLLLSDLSLVLNLLKVHFRLIDSRRGSGFCLCFVFILCHVSSKDRLVLFRKVILRTGSVFKRFFTKHSKPLYLPISRTREILCSTSRHSFIRICSSLPSPSMTSTTKRRTPLPHKTPRFHLSRIRLLRPLGSSATRPDLSPFLSSQEDHVCLCRCSRPVRQIFQAFHFIPENFLCRTHI